jgi:DNA repair exonuclease SbcCD ATPase subunit
MEGVQMSNTPRTDDQIGYDGSTMSAIRIEFCRKLERELNAANVEIEEKRKDVVWLATEKAKLEERIKRLEEALDLVRPHCSFVHHSKKHQHAYDEPCPVVALIEKSKEAKP